MKPSGLIAQVVEAYTARACSRIANMIEMQIRKYPEAAEALTNLAEQVRMYSLVFGPGDAEHPQRGTLRSVQATLQPTFEAPKEIRLERAPRPEPSAPKPPRASKTQAILTYLREGRTPGRIAVLVGCTRPYVYHVKNKFKDQLNGRPHE